MLICYDVEFPEAVRALALAGANLLLIPTALTPEYDAVPGAIVPARALENQVFVAYCNHAGTENGLAYLGGSCIASPDGRKLANAGPAETLLIVDLDPAMIPPARRRSRTGVNDGRRFMPSPSKRNERRNGLFFVNKKSDVS